MRPSTQHAWLSPPALLAILVTTALILSACSMSTTSRHDDELYFVPSMVTPRETSHYTNLLSELPLRIDAKRFHLIAQDAGGPAVAVREFHLLRDTRDPGSSKDILLAILDNNHMFAFSAIDFTLLWKGILDTRTRYAPVMTNESIYFIDEHGDYQRFSRFTGELIAKDHFGVGRRPSTQPTANENHVVMPTSQNRSVTGWSTLRAKDKGLSLSAQNWAYPGQLTGEDDTFEMVTLPPVTDTETVYFVSNNNFLYGVDTQTGQFRFKTDLGQAGVIYTPPVLKGDTIYVGGTSELFAVARSGEVRWSYPVAGPVKGQIYAMDDQVYFNTLKIENLKLGGDRFRELPLGHTTGEPAELEIGLKRDALSSVTVGRTRVPRYDPDKFDSDDERGAVKTTEDGEIIYDIDVIKPPRHADWSIKNQGQQILLKTSKYLFVVYEQWEVPYTQREEQLLWRDNRIVREEELRVATKRVLQVLDVNTGQVVTRGSDEWSWDISQFAFIQGSMQENDRALYLCTKDGHIFKAIARD